MNSLRGAIIKSISQRSHCSLAFVGRYVCDQGSRLVGLLLVGLLLVGLAGLSPSTAWAQVTAERIFPPAVRIGEQATLNVEGKFAEWSSTQIYCDREHIGIQLGEKAGELLVDVPADQHPGVTWLRLHDAKSASQLLPLIIYPEQLTTEVEPNDAPGGTPCNLPCGVTGRLEKRGDIDGFLIEAKAGRTLVASLTAHEVLGSPMDGVLQVVDLAGNVLAQSEDERGLDPQIVFTPDSDQDLVVRLFAFPEVPNSTIGFSGSTSFVYLLTLTDQAYVDHALPLVIDDDDDKNIAIPSQAFAWSGPCGNPEQLPGTQVSPATLVSPRAGQWQWLMPTPRACVDGERAGYHFDVVHFDDVDDSEDSQSDVPADALPPATLPAIFSGHILQPGEIDRFLFSTGAPPTDDESSDSGKSKNPMKCRAEVYSQKLGYTLDSVLRIVDADSGQELAKADDISRNDYDAAVEFAVGETTKAELQISDVADSGSPRHAYSVVIREILPGFAVSVDAEQFLLKQAAETEIKVTVSRLNGFDRALEIFAVDLPAGVTCSSVVSEPKGDSSKAVTLKLVASADCAPFQGMFQIQATDAPTQRKLAASYRLRPQVPLTNLWLSVISSPPAN